MRRPTWWQRIGGDNALSRWSWIVAMPSGVALALSSAGSVPHLFPWLITAVLANAVAAAVLAVASLTILRPGNRPVRTLAALATFAIAGAVRGALLTLGYRWVGAPDPMSAAERVLGNAVLAIVLLSLIAIVVDSSRRHTRLIAELLIAQRTLDALSEAKEEELRRIDGEVDRCLAVAADTTAPGIPTEGYSLWLRECAEAVRRVSHDLHRDSSTDPPLPSVPDPRPWDRISPLLRRMGPAAPVPCAFIIEIAPLTGVASQSGWQVALFNALVGGTVLTCLAMVVRRWYRRAARGVPNLLLLTAVYTAVALIAMYVTRYLGMVVGVEVPLFPLGVPYIVGVALGLSLVAAVKDGYAADLRQREEAVSAAALRADANAEEVRERRRTLAALLHGPVQGELLRAAAGSTDVARVAARVRGLLAEPPAVVPAEQEVADVVGAWRTVLDLEMAAPTELWPVLDEHPVTRQAVIDVISEGLGNAVRHANGTRVRLDLGVTGKEVSIAVTSQGTLDAEPAPGLGSAILERRCSSWRIAAQDREVRLDARIPITAAPPPDRTRLGPQAGSATRTAAVP